MSTDADETSEPSEKQLNTVESGAELRVQTVWLGLDDGRRVRARDCAGPEEGDPWTLAC
jgi:hypothetical protein